MPSIGFEPMTFPMSRERATPAPTGLKFKTKIGCDLGCGARSLEGNDLYFTSPAPTGLK